MKHQIHDIASSKNLSGQSHPFKRPDQRLQIAPSTSPAHVQESFAECAECDATLRPDLGSLWNRRFEELRAFKALHGHLRIPVKPPSTRQLAMWASTQRRFKIEERLCPERIQRLESLGFAWKPLDNYWKKMYRELKSVMQGRNGDFPNSRLPSQLQSWVKVQRKHKRDERLSADRVRSLEAIGFQWNPIPEYFERRFRQLLQFRLRYGLGDFSVLYSSHESLATWLRKQRKHLKSGPPYSEWQKRLLRIGVVPSGTARPPDEISLAAIVAEYMRGDRLIDIAGRQGVSKAQVSYWIKKYGDRYGGPGFTLRKPRRPASNRDTIASAPTFPPHEHKKFGSPSEQAIGHVHQKAQED